jgi:hypothetical protein
LFKFATTYVQHYCRVVNENNTFCTVGMNATAGVIVQFSLRDYNNVLLTEDRPGGQIDFQLKRLNTAACMLRTQIKWLQLPIFWLNNQVNIGVHIYLLVSMHI